MSTVMDVQAPKSLTPPDQGPLDPDGGSACRPPKRLGLFTGHLSLSAVTHAPFHVSVLRPVSQVGPMHKAAGMGKLVSAALLSLINEACVSVCRATLLLSQLVGLLVCRHDRVTREVGRVGLMGRDRGRRGY